MTNIQVLVTLYTHIHTAVFVAGRLVQDEGDHGSDERVDPEGDRKVGFARPRRRRLPHRRQVVLHEQTRRRQVSTYTHNTHTRAHPETHTHTHVHIQKHTPTQKEAERFSTSLCVLVPLLDSLSLAQHTLFLSNSLSLCSYLSPSASLTLVHKHTHTHTHENNHRPNTHTHTHTHSHLVSHSEKSVSFSHQS